MGSSPWLYRSGECSGQSGVLFLRLRSFRAFPDFYLGIKRSQVLRDCQHRRTVVQDLISVCKNGLLITALRQWPVSRRSRR